MTDESAPPVQPAVQTIGLTRTYGAMTALNALDLSIHRGDLFGFIGSNGAGKTTTLRILATFLTPSAGQAIVLGHDVVKEADAVRHLIGYMPDFFGVYKDMEVTEYLDFFGACYRIPTAQREKTVSDVLELVGLTEKKGALIGALSRGMQQRLGLARVLIHDPQVLLLDEPASGLDPRARIEMMAILQELQRLGKNGRLGDKPQSDRGKRNADLTDRQVLVQLVLHMLGRSGAADSVVEQFSRTRGAHLDGCEFCKDEEAVQQNQQDSQNQIQNFHELNAPRGFQERRV